MGRKMVYYFIIILVFILAGCSGTDPVIENPDQYYVEHTPSIDLNELQNDSDKQEIENENKDQEFEIGSQNPKEDENLDDSIAASSDGQTTGDNQTGDQEDSLDEEQKEEVQGDLDQIQDLESNKGSQGESGNAGMEEEFQDGFGDIDTEDLSDPVKKDLNDITEERYREYDNQKEAWSFKRMTGNQPIQSYEAFDISEYSGFYRDKNVEDGDKVIYLTFDCGYENGFTPAILTALKEHNAKAMFFVTEHFVEQNVDLIKQMKEEGHMVGNHTLNHPSLPTISIEQIKDEVTGLEALMYEKTGYPLDPFFRPPMGEYSRRTLKVLEDMGYKTIFWSMAYLDYDVQNQPGKEYVINHFIDNHHNGAIPLIHNVSQSNSEALDTVLSNLENENYRFGTLDELHK